LKTGGKQIAAQQDHFKKNFVNPGIENNFLLTNSVKCTCQLCQHTLRCRITMVYILSSARV